jgi:hypothetical protein
MIRGRGPLLALAGLAGLLCAADVAKAQLREDLRLGGYYLGVGSGYLEGPFTPSGASLFQRVRIMMSPDIGPLRTDGGRSRRASTRPGATGSIGF